MTSKKSTTEAVSRTSSDASDVTRYFFLNDISLWESTLRREREFRWGEHSTEGCATQAFRTIEPEIVEVAVQGESEPQIMLRALVKLGVRVVQKTDEEGVDPFYTLETTFCADYFVLTPPPEEMFKKFIAFNCIHNVWPFWRQHVFDTLKRAALPVPTVPLYASQSKYRKKKVKVTRVLGSADQTSPVAAD